MPNQLNTHPCPNLACLHEWRGALLLRIYAENLLTQLNPFSNRSRFEAVQVRSGYTDQFEQAVSTPKKRSIVNSKR